MLSSQQSISHLKYCAVMGLACGAGVSSRRCACLAHPYRHMNGRSVQTSQTWPLLSCFGLFVFSMRIDVLVCFRDLGRTQCCTHMHAGKRLKLMPSPFALMAAWTCIIRRICGSVPSEKSSHRAWPAWPIIEPSIRMDMLMC